MAEDRIAARLARLRRLMDDRGYDAVILRNNSDLVWLTGATRIFDEEPAHTAFITREGAWLHTDSRYYDALDVALSSENPGSDGAWVVDKEVVGHPAWVAKMVASKHARMIAIEDTLTLEFADGLERAIERAGVACLMAHLHGELVGMRAVKDPGEVEAMRAAQAVTDATFTHMCEYIQPGMTELEVRAELEHFMFTHGADALAFATIIASGPNSAVPHAQPGDRVIQRGDLVLMDYGASRKDYRSDMTRTVCVGELSDELGRVYDTVRRVNEACEAAVKPGVSGRELHMYAARLIDEAGYAGKFGHGLGHGVGIDIHELPRLGRVSDSVFEPGNVLTIEPGIYLPGLGGVRLEDYGVVTEDGFDVFTTSTHDLVTIPC